MLVCAAHIRVRLHASKGDVLKGAEEVASLERALAVLRRALQCEALRAVEDVEPVKTFQLVIAIHAALLGEVRERAGGRHVVARGMEEELKGWHFELDKEEEEEEERPRVSHGTESSPALLSDASQVRSPMSRRVEGVVVDLSLLG